MRIGNMKSYKKKIISSPGFVAHQRIKQIELSLYVVKYNYLDLKKLFDIYKDPVSALGLWKPENVDKLMGVQMQIQRYFSNYVSAALSLVAHARVFMKSYIGTDFSNNYEEMVKSNFVDNGLHRFIQNLRNYIMHYKMPLASPELKLGKNIDNDVFLIKSDMLVWSEWKKPARDWLDSQPEKISFSQVSEEYYKMIETFYKWFFRELENIHKQDYEQTNAMMKRSNELLDRPHQE